MKTGVECEYHLITTDGTQLADQADTQAKALLRPARADATVPGGIGAIMRLACSKLGWNPYQNDHEDANGQFEMNWDYDDALQDRRQARFLQVHGENHCRGTRHAGNVHAQAVLRT